MVEGVFGHVALVELVRFLVQIGIVFAVGEQHTPAVVGKIRTEEAAGCEVIGQAAQPSIVGLEVLEDVQATPRARPPAVVLVRHVGETTGRAFHEEQVVEVEKWVGQRHLANCLPGCEVGVSALLCPSISG
jgi:hypothetical protein